MRNCLLFVRPIIMDGQEIAGIRSFSFRKRKVLVTFFGYTRGEVYKSYDFGSAKIWELHAPIKEAIEASHGWGLEDAWDIISRFPINLEAWKAPRPYEEWPWGVETYIDGVTPVTEDVEKDILKRTFRNIFIYIHQNGGYKDAVLRESAELFGVSLAVTAKEFEKKTGVDPSKFGWEEFLTKLYRCCIKGEEGGDPFRFILAGQHIKRGKKWVKVRPHSV